MATVDCRQCNETMERLKTADWNRYDAEKKYADAVDFNRKFTIWVKERFTERQIHIQFPEPSVLEQMYVNVPVTRSPERPVAPDPRTSVSSG